MLNANYMFEMKIVICNKLGYSAIFTSITRTRYDEFANGLWDVQTHFCTFFSKTFAFAN